MIGIVTAMADETGAMADLHDRSRYRVRRSGVGPKRAATAAKSLLDEGCTALISAGICGGLAPNLKAGTLVLATEVADPDGTVFPVDETWRSAIEERIGATVPVASGCLTGSARVVRRPVQKRDLAATAGAVAVDMESHAVARVARDAGVPFLVLRAVSDAVDSELPKSALFGVSKNGMRTPLRVVGALLRRPGDLPGLLRLAKDTEKALGTLRRVAALGAPVDFGLQ